MNHLRALKKGGSNSAEQSAREASVGTGDLMSSCPRQRRDASNTLSPKRTETGIQRLQAEYVCCFTDGWWLWQKRCNVHFLQGFSAPHNSVWVCVRGMCACVHICVIKSTAFARFHPLPLDVVVASCLWEKVQRATTSASFLRNEIGQGLVQEVVIGLEDWRDQRMELRHISVARRREHG